MRFSVFPILICCYASQTVAWRSFMIRFSGVRCIKQSNLISFVNCDLSELSQRQQGLSVRFKLAAEIHQFKLDLALLMVRPKQPDFALANLTDIDGCHFLDKTTGFNVLNIIHKELEKFSTLPIRCPVAKNTEVFIKNLYMDENNFPPYVPQTSFKVALYSWEKLTPIFQLFLNGSVIARNRGKV